MRKLILISVLLLASASVQAGGSRGLVLAANDTPAVTDTAKPEAPKAEAVQPETLKPETAAAPETAQPRASKPAKKVHARRYESDEAKARRIAARYGISW
jgi:hypothetical protein